MGWFSDDIETMEHLFVHGLQDIYYAERLIEKSLPDMIEKASDAELKRGFRMHLKQTKGQIKRLEQAFKKMERTPQGTKCPAIDGILDEANEIAGDVSDKVVLFTYSGYTNSPEKHFSSYYSSVPNMIYLAKPWMEVLLGMVIVYTDNRRSNDSWEFRPVAGVKFYIPNEKKWAIYNFTRFEYRLIIQDDKAQKIPRFRNRIGFEAPLTSTEKAWTPKTWYVLADVEPIFRLDTKRLQVVRVRGGLGYVFNRNWRAEMIYHHETSGTATFPFDHTGNIFRLNLKLSLPRKGWRYPKSPDVD